MTAADIGDIVWSYVRSPAEYADLMAMLHDPGADVVRPVRTKEPPDCGSYTSYRQHLYYGEDTDDACKAARAADIERRRAEQDPETRQTWLKRNAANRRASRARAREMSNDRT